MLVKPYSALETEQQAPVDAASYPNAKSLFQFKNATNGVLAETLGGKSLTYDANQIIVATQYIELGQLNIPTDFDNNAVIEDYTAGDHFLYLGCCSMDTSGAARMFGYGDIAVGTDSYIGIFVSGGNYAAGLGDSPDFYQVGSGVNCNFNNIKTAAVWGTVGGASKGLFDGGAITALTNGTTTTAPAMNFSTQSNKIQMSRSRGRFMSLSKIPYVPSDDFMKACVNWMHHNIVNNNNRTLYPGLRYIG